jgi:hypothetical protein
LRAAGRRAGGRRGGKFEVEFFSNMKRSVHVIQCGKCRTIIGDSSASAGRPADEDEELDVVSNVKLTQGTRIKCAECGWPLGTYSLESKMYYLESNQIKRYRVQSESAAGEKESGKQVVTDNWVTKKQLAEVTTQLEKDVTDLKETVLAIMDRLQQQQQQG